MFRQTWCQRPGAVPFGGKAFFEKLVCDDTGLGKSIHPLSNLNVDPAIRSGNVAKVVMDNDFIGDDVRMETHVFRVQHGGVEVEIGRVDGQKLCPRGTDGGIDEEFGHGEIGCWCAFVTKVADAIATNGEPNAIFLFFLWSITAANAAVVGAFVSWNM